MIGEAELIKWISPKAERMAGQAARDRANAARWNLDVAVFLFGVLAIVFILGFERVSIWVTAPVAIFGLGTVWLVGWRRARQVYGRFLDEELSQHAVDFEDYYEILGISPSAESEDIVEAYKRLTHIHDEALPEKRIRMPIFSLTKGQIIEAYQTLSDPVARAAYDHVFWTKFNAETVGIDQAIKQEILGLAEAITQDRLEAKRKVGWRIPVWGKVTRQVILGVVIALLVMFFGGTSFAFAKPEHALATPFRGAAIALLKTSAGAIGLIEDIRGIIATHERKIISTALQSMRVEESLQYVPLVTSPTNDMARFPSREYSLFPEYLETRFSQFRYTVDSNGIVSVDTSWAATDAFLDRVKHLLARLGEKE